MTSTTAARPVEAALTPACCLLRCWPGSCTIETECWLDCPHWARSLPAGLCSRHICSVLHTSKQYIGALSAQSGKMSTGCSNNSRDGASSLQALAVLVVVLAKVAAKV